MELWSDKKYIQKKNIFVDKGFIEEERTFSDPLPSNFHVAFHTFTLLSPNIKSTLIPHKFDKSIFFFI